MWQVIARLVPLCTFTRVQSTQEKLSSDTTQGLACENPAM